MKKLDTDWSRISLLALTAGIYLVVFLFDPAQAKISIVYSLREIRKLFIPLLVAIFVGVTIKNLITPDLVLNIFDSNKGVITAGTVGSILPPCPFIAYPVIKGFTEKGLKLPITMTMLVTATLVEMGQIFCGLAVFGPKIAGIRIGFAFIGAIIVGTVFLLLHSYVLQNTRIKS